MKNDLSDLIEVDTFLYPEKKDLQFGWLYWSVDIDFSRPKLLASAGYLTQEFSLIGEKCV